MSQVISFPIGLSPRTMQDLGSVSWGFAHAKALFDSSSELEDTNTNLQELFSPRSRLKVFRAAVIFLCRGLTGAAREVRGSSGPWWGRGPCTWCQTPVELGTSWQFSICGPVGWPSSFPLGVWPCLNKLSHFIVASVIPTDGANCRVLVWGVLHCRCERTQTQQANIMNLVEKRAQELGLCEDFVNGRAGLLRSEIIKGVEEE